MATKSIKIDEDIHKRAVRLADQKETSLKEYIESLVTYFYQTGLDPTDLNNSEYAGILTGLGERLASLETYLRDDQHQQLLSLQGMLSPQEHSLNGVASSEPAQQTELNELIKELFSEGVCCPKCKQPQDFHFEDPHLRCQHDGCGYHFPIVFGEVVLESLDVMNLLTGGITRHFSRLTFQAKTTAGRLYLDPNKNFEVSLQEED